MANIDEKAGISEIGTAWNKHGTTITCTQILSFFGGSSSSYGGTVLRETSEKTGSSGCVRCF